MKRESAMPKTTLMQDLCRYIARHSDEKMLLKDLAAQAQMSPAHFQKRFRAEIGVSPKEYHDACRMARFKKGLKSSSVTASLYAAGFNAPSRVYEKAGARLGMTPRQYARDAEKLAISHAVAKTPLGLVMIAATDRGICFIQFAASRPELERMLAAEFPAAALSPMDRAARPAFGAWMKSLNRYLAGETAKLDLPLDIRGTAFQVKVWKYLQRIPRGRPQSYAAVARALGMPKAARAVARACATNRIGVAIPCHRVIRGDGGLSGYRWGAGLKRQLLEIEERG